MLDAFEAWVASTDFGKGAFIKPRVQEKIDVVKQSLAEGRASIAEIKSVQNMPVLQDTLVKLANRADLVIADLEAQLDLFADIIGNQIGKFSSIKEFEKKIETSPALKDMLSFIEEIIDLENYTYLTDTLMQASDFENLSKPKQQEVIRSLSNQEYIQNITHENRRLDLDALKVKALKMLKGLENEFEISEANQEQLNKFANQLLAKHLKPLNNFRMFFVNNLETFMQAELKRVQALLPEEPKRTAKSKTVVRTATAIEKPAPQNTTTKPGGPILTGFTIKCATSQEDSSSQQSEEPAHQDKKRRVTRGTH